MRLTTYPVVVKPPKHDIIDLRETISWVLDKTVSFAPFNTSFVVVREGLCRCKLVRKGSILQGASPKHLDCLSDPIINYT